MGGKSTKVIPLAPKNSENASNGNSNPRFASAPVEEVNKPREKTFFTAKREKTFFTAKSESAGKLKQHDSKDSKKLPIKVENKENEEQKTEDTESEEKEKKAQAFPLDIEEKAHNASDLTMCTLNCQYYSVKSTAKRFGFREVKETSDWNLFWADNSDPLERVMDKMKTYQKINHFPGTSEICRKDLLAKNLNRMSKLFPNDYNIYPKTWYLPADSGSFSAYAKGKNGYRTYILKPESGSQGRGIWITNNYKDIDQRQHQVCQIYIPRPFLIDGLKFDLRIYVLVTSCDPLRIFVFKDGLARFATTKYTDPNNNNAVNNNFMHLTNYAINKCSRNFVVDEETGSKRRITTINRWFEENGYDVEKLWDDIDDIIIKTLISGHEIMKHNYRALFPRHVKTSACFEILGYDILLDHNLKPYVLEVNYTPNFHTDSQLDKEIKEALIYNTLLLVNFGICSRRRCIEEQKRLIRERTILRKPRQKWTKEDFDKEKEDFVTNCEKHEDQNLGNFRRIYPSKGTQKYDKYFEQGCGSLFQETATQKARMEYAKSLRQGLVKDQEKMLKPLKRSVESMIAESPFSSSDVKLMKRNRRNIQESPSNSKKNKERFKLKHK